MALLSWGYFAGIIATTVTKASFLRYMDLIDENGRNTPGSADKLGAMSSIFQVSYGQRQVYHKGYMAKRLK